MKLTKILLLRTLVVIEAAYIALLGILAVILVVISGLFSTMDTTNPISQQFVLIAALTLSVSITLVAIILIAGFKLGRSAWASWLLAIFNGVICISGIGVVILAPGSRDLALLLSILVSAIILLMLFMPPTVKTLYFRR